MTATTTTLAAVRTQGLWRRGISPVIALAILVMIAVVVMAVFGGAIAPHSASEQNYSAILAHVSASHWLGTDEVGRDVFSRLIVGARTALVGPLVIAGASMVVGNGLGLLAGFRRGLTESVIMRWVDVMYSLPYLLVVIVIAGTIGGGYWLAVGLLWLLTVPFDTRVAYGATLEQVPRPYVEAAKAIGVRDRRIMVLHIWPNIAATVVANAFLNFAASLVALSSLSFLGLGAPPGSTDWGVMLAQGNDLLFNNPVAILAPGVMIVLTATSMNLIGDWIYDRLSSRGEAR